MDRDQGGALTLRLLTGQRAEMAALQRVLEAAPAYFLTVTGLPPGNAEAQSTFTALPMIGCADVIRGYPVREKAVIGLLLLAEPWQHRGLGRPFATLIEQAICAWPEIERLRLGVAASNTTALTFWRKLGYRETGEVKSPPPGMVAEVHVFEKPLQRGPA